jgi:hypothetical protein
MCKGVKLKLTNKEYLKQYELNTILVNFDNIPKHLSTEFINTLVY